MNRASGDLNLLRKIKKLKQEVDNISIVSGESSGDDWSSITIDGVTKAIPSKTRVFRHKFDIEIDAQYKAVIFLIDTIEAPITKNNYADRCSAALITSRVIDNTASPRKRYIIQTISSGYVYFFNATNTETSLTITENSVFHVDSVLEL